MALPTQTELEAAIENGMDNLSKWDSVVNGDNQTLVSTDSGDVPSISKFYFDVEDRYGDAQLAAQEASDARDEAQSARDAAVAGASGLFASSAAGIAATSDGDYFSVVSGLSSAFLDLYLNDAGTAVFQKSYPSAQAVSEGFDAPLVRATAGLGPNWGDTSRIREGYIDASGVFQSNVNYEASEAIPVDENMPLDIRVDRLSDFTAGTFNVTFYNGNMERLGGYDMVSLREEVTPSDHVSGCRYVVVTNPIVQQGAFPQGFLFRQHVPGRTVNLFDSMETSPTFFDQSTLTWGTSDGWKMTGLVPVFQGQKFILNVGGNSSSYPNVIGLDEFGDYVAALHSQSVEFDGEVEVTISNPGVKYVRFGSALANENGVREAWGVVPRHFDQPLALVPEDILGIAGEETPVFPRSLLVDRRFPVGLSCESSTERGVILDNTDGNVQRYSLETMVDGGRARLNFGKVGFRFYAAGTEPVSDLNVICLGDSTTEGTGANVGGNYKDWPNELSWQVTGVGDRALSGDTYFTSWGLTKVHFRGTMGLNTVKHEGRGGWSAEDYLTLASKSGRDNAFWNAAANGGAGDFDFDFYLTDNGFDVGSDATGVDATGSNCVVFIQLGWNDMSNKSPANAAADTGTIIDKILSARADTNIVVLGFGSPPVNVPIRRQNLPAEGRIITPETIFRTAVLAHRDAYRAMVDTKGANVQFYDLAPTFDGDTGFTIDSDYWKVVPWSTDDQFTASRDYVHPNEKGNMMWARAIKALMARDFL